MKNRKWKILLNVNKFKIINQIIIKCLKINNEKKIMN